jgi:hypothetical protein
MPWYPRIHAAIKRVLPALLPTQSTNLALLVSALLAKRSACLSELARAYPRRAAEQRRLPSPRCQLVGMCQVAHSIRILSRYHPLPVKYTAARLATIKPV